MDRSKYNVSSDTEKRTCNGIVFDSVMEMKYYRDVVLPGVESGDITHYELQKPYELQPKFTRDGRSVRAITYVADFYIEHSDGSNEIIDIKGAADSVAKLKRKLMWFRYPDYRYVWLTYVKKFGGWIDYEAATKLRKQVKLLKQKEDFMNERDNDNGEEESCCNCG